MGVLDGFEAKFEVVKLEASNVVHLGLREALRTQLVFCRPECRRGDKGIDVPKPDEHLGVL